MIELFVFIFSTSCSSIHYPPPIPLSKEPFLQFLAAKASESKACLGVQYPPHQRLGFQPTNKLVAGLFLQPGNYFITQ